MASSDVDICNIGLLRSGVKQLISSFDEQSAIAQACNVLYPQTRDFVLRAFPWPFATKRQSLPLLANTTRTNWSFCYQLPNDLIFARFVVPAERVPRADQRIPYGIEASDDGASKILCTDQGSAELVYVARVTSVPFYPPDFVNALAWKLVSEFAMSITTRPDLVAPALNAYKAALLEAGQNSLQEQQSDFPPDSEIISERA